MGLKISDLGAATLPLVGTELMELETVGGESVNATVNDIAAAVPGVDAEFVVLAVSPSLANERVLTAGANIAIVDNGAGNSVVISGTSAAPVDSVFGRIGVVVGVVTDYATVGLQFNDNVALVLGTGSDATVDFDGTNLEMDSAGGVRIRVASGELAFLAEANGFSAMYSDSIRRLSAEASGLVTIRSDGNTDAEVRQLVFEHQDGTDRGLVGHLASDVLTLRNIIDGGNVTVTASDAISVERTILSGDPDGVTFLRGDTNVELQASAGTIAFQAVAAGLTLVRGAGNVELQVNAGNIAFRGTSGGAAALFHNNVENARTIVAASGGMEVNNLSTGAGFERVLTTSDIGGGGGGGVIKYKTADQSVSNSTVLQNDNDLAGFAIDAAGIYRFRAFFIYFQNIGDLIFRWSFSQAQQSINFRWSANDTAAAVSIDEYEAAISTVDVNGPIDGLEASIILDGTFLANAALASTLTLQWAQRISTGNATIMRANTWMEVEKLN